MSSPAARDELNVRFRLGLDGAGHIRRRHMLQSDGLR